MNHKELRETRERLGLSPKEAAEVLETNTTTIHRMERDPNESTTAREAPARVEQLYRAYMGGFRPYNWPERLVGREERLAEVVRPKEAEE